jgi:methionyl aminopeptidase
MLKPNVNISKISKKIESLIDKNKYRIVSELCGHQIQQYKIHSGNVIPNIYLENYHKKIKNYEVYTIEPYISTSKENEIYTDHENCSHYMFNYHEKIFDDQSLLKLIPELYKFKTLAFNKRWLQPKTKLYLENLVLKQLYNKYPPMYDKDKSSKVSQFETTVIVNGDEPIILKKFDSVDKYIIH